MRLAGGPDARPTPRDYPGPPTPPRAALTASHTHRSRRGPSRSPRRRADLFRAGQKPKWVSCAGTVHKGRAPQATLKRFRHRPETLFPRTHSSDVRLSCPRPASCHLWPSHYRQHHVPVSLSRCHRKRSSSEPPRRPAWLRLAPPCPPHLALRLRARTQRRPRARERSAHRKQSLAHLS